MKKTLLTILVTVMMLGMAYPANAALVYGNALKCVLGSSQYARRNNASTVNDNFTMTAWVYVDAYGAGSTAIFQNGANDARGFAMYLTSAGVLHADYAFVVDGNSGQTIPTGSWHHIALRRNSGTSQFYYDGASVGSSWGNTPNSAGSGDWITLCGSTSSGGSTTQLASIRIDDARFYERALSTTEITNLYNNGNVWPYTDISNTSLAMWYKLDETSGTSASDSGSKGYTLTTSGTPTWVQGIVATGASVIAFFTFSSF